MPTKQQFLADRRKHPRPPIEAQVTVLHSEFWTVGDLDALSGWTHNVSEGGVCFSVPYRLSDTQLLLHIDYEGLGAEYVVVTVVHTEDCHEDGWKYHCRIDRVLAAMSPLDCIEESMFQIPEHSVS